MSVDGSRSDEIHIISTRSRITLTIMAVIAITLIVAITTTASVVSGQFSPHDQAAPSGDVSLRVTTPDVNFDPPEPSTDPTLRTITINGVEVDGFSSSTTAYSHDVDGLVTQVTVAAISTDPRSRWEVLFPLDADASIPRHQVNLEIGENVVVLRCTAKDMSTQDYTLVVNRADNVPFTRKVSEDIITLDSNGINAPMGIWANETVMYVVDRANHVIYALDRVTQQPLPARYFTDTSRHTYGLWGNETHVFVSDDAGRFENPGSGGPVPHVFAYSSRSTHYDSRLSFDLPSPPYQDYAQPTGIWSDGETMWVGDGHEFAHRIFAYEYVTGERLTDRDIRLPRESPPPSGLWSDGEIMWIVDRTNERIYAYSLSKRMYVPGLDFDTLADAGNTSPTGIWSDGETMWVADDDDDKIYAYNMPSGEVIADEIAMVSDGSGDTESPDVYTSTHINPGPAEDPANPSHTGAIDYPGDTDWVRVSFNLANHPSRTYRIVAEWVDSNNRIHTSVGMRDLYGEPIGGTYRAENAPEGRSSYVYYADSKRRHPLHFIEVKAIDPEATGTYRLSVLPTPDDVPRNNHRSGRHWQESDAAGNALAIDYKGDSDWFRLQYEPGRTYTLNAISEDSTLRSVLQLEGYTSTGHPLTQTLVGNDGIISFDAQSREIVFKTSNRRITGENFIVVAAVAGENSTGRYGITVDEEAAASPPPDPDSSLTDHASATLRDLTEKHSPRGAGTQQEHDAALYLAKRLEDLGYAVSLQEFPLKVAPATEVVAMTSPGDRRVIRATALEGAVFGAATGTLAHVGLAGPGDIPEEGLEGKIALIERGEFSYGKKVERVTEAGAVAAVIYDQYQETIPFRGWMPGYLPSVPTALISRAAGRHLSLQIEHTGVDASVAVNEGSLLSRNIIADKGQPYDGGPIVIIGAHYDTLGDSQGASDNGSGVAAVLTIAEQIADQTYPFDVRVVLFGSEEGGGSLKGPLNGSRHYVKNMPAEETGGVIVMVNFDSLGSGTTLLTTGDLRLTRKIEEIGRSFGMDIGLFLEKDWTWSRTGGASDHAAFRLAGIPTVYLTSDDYSRINTPKDTIDHINPVLIGQGAEVGIRVIESLADGLLTSDSTTSAASSPPDPAAEVGTVDGDREALVALHRSAGGDNWKFSQTWLTDAPLDKWRGVTTDEAGRVTELIMFDELTGTVPPEIGNLTNLVKLQLGISALTGELPGEIGNLSKLEILDIGPNFMTGPIPPEIGRLTNLHTLTITWTEISGEIPSTLGNLNNLQELYLSSNRLSGEFPDALKSLENLEVLDLHHNRLTGCLPDELAEVEPRYSDPNPGLYLCSQTRPSHPADREALIAFYNEAGGSYWSEGRDWLNPDVSLAAWHGVEVNDDGRVTKIALQSNNLTGKLSPALEDLTSLTGLFVEGNEGLEGCVPAGLFDVPDNDLTTLELAACGGSGE